MLYLVSMERSVAFPRTEGNVIDQAGCFENTRPLPRRGKARSVSGFALLYLLKRLLRRYAPRNARSAFKRFSQSPSLIFSPPSGFRNTSNLEREGVLKCLE